MTSTRRLRTILQVAAAVVLQGAWIGGAEARPYTVVSCDSAGLFGYNAGAWAPYGSGGWAYSDCPSGGGLTAGISNRLVNATVSGFTGSGHAFTAPPGTTITHLRWGGRLAREHCYWGAFIRAMPSGAPVFGLPQNQYCATTGADNRGFPMSFPIPSGTTRLEQVVVCGASQCKPGATLHSQQVEVTLDDPVAPSVSLSGPLASGRWVSGHTRPHVGISARDNAGTSRLETVIGDKSETTGYPCDWSQAAPCPRDIAVAETPDLTTLSDARHQLRVSALDVAGNSASAVAEVYVDNTPPDPVVPRVAGGDAWRRANAFAASWTSSGERAAPIVRAHWKLCSVDGGCPARGHRDGLAIRELPALSAPAPGAYHLHVWLEDQAGNQREANAAASALVRFDPVPPQLAFQPPDPDEPLRVVVEASDRHSGVAAGEIEIRARGTSSWHGLPTQAEPGALVAHVDDQRFRSGSYEFRARASDHAGNETSTAIRTDGFAATLRLPARIETTLSVGRPRIVTRRRLVRRNGRRRWVRRRVRVLDSQVVARHGRAVRLWGALANSDGQPVEGGTIEALETAPEGTRVIGLATTGPDGEFTYVVGATRNRSLLFRYRGSRRIGAAEEPFSVRVPAATSMRADRSRLRNGQQVTFTGRVATRPVPAAGKLLEMQSHFRGRWRTFSTVRTDRNGRWRFGYRFGATTGRVVYPFRARLPAEGGYPFIDGHSRVVEVVVSGP